MNNKIITDEEDKSAEPHCPNCGGLHYGTVMCPYAVPFVHEDSLGKARGLEHTQKTISKHGEGEQNE